MRNTGVVAAALRIWCNTSCNGSQRGDTLAGSPGQVNA
jgi:hypothetical protein